MTATILLFFVITALAYFIYPAMKQYFLKTTSSSKHQTSSIPQQSPSSIEDGAALDEPAFIPEDHQTPRPKSSKALSRLSRMANVVRNNTILKDPSLDVPLKAQLPIYVVGFFYCVSRTMIYILDLIQLRSLPLSAYDNVDWGGFLPHWG